MCIRDSLGALIIAVHHTIRYGKKFKASGQVVNLNELPENMQEVEEREFNTQDKLILLVLVVTIGILAVSYTHLYSDR